MTGGGLYEGPDAPARSVSMISDTASISARCVNACGKLPRCWPVVASISSAYSIRGPAKDSSFSHRARARCCSPIMASAVTSQKEQMVNVPSSPENPVSVPSTL